MAAMVEVDQREVTVKLTEVVEEAEAEAIPDTGLTSNSMTRSCF